MEKVVTPLNAPELIDRLFIVFEVGAVIIPVDETWNWEVEPTVKRPIGAVVPIPTLPPLNQEEFAPATFVPESLIKAEEVAVDPTKTSSETLMGDNA